MCGWTAAELDEALSRLGPPAQAARTFAARETAPPAPVGRRFIALFIDNLPLIGVTIALLAQGVTRLLNGTEGVMLAAPPWFYVKTDSSCVAVGPVICDSAVYQEAGLLHALAIVGLGLLEYLTGTTPGKRLTGLRVVSDSGLRLHPVAALARRLCVVLGPLAWLDRLPAVWGDSRRLLDHVTGTQVVRVAREA
ncbi:RDD family protein [Spongiactinospora sp. TRM90649]|uniref:RDD family protein n=1 Tax=Spongiactinospora sp. TRM90649 TaxID=3031114 RepID=UPI0023F6B0B7|nr:RDD family protein [Spongiactinospora sp. TRM90649]MDF5754939.1 RDD family protein [Spongiactinospora sp. TRM90649]